MTYTEELVELLESYPTRRLIESPEVQDLMLRIVMERFTKERVWAADGPGCAREHTPYWWRYSEAGLMTKYRTSELHVDTLSWTKRGCEVAIAKKAAERVTVSLPYRIEVPTPINMPVHTGLPKVELTRNEAAKLKKQLEDQGV